MAAVKSHAYIKEVGWLEGQKEKKLWTVPCGEIGGIKEFKRYIHVHRDPYDCFWSYDKWRFSGSHTGKVTREYYTKAPFMEAMKSSARTCALHHRACLTV